MICAHSFAITIFYLCFAILCAQTRESTEAVANEAVQAAASEIAAAQERLGREASARKELERTVEDLGRRLRIERQQHKISEEDLMLIRRDWEYQTMSVLSKIREDCNAAFEKTAPPTPAVPASIARSSIAASIPFGGVGGSTGTQQQKQRDSTTTPKSIGTAETAVQDEDSPLGMGGAATVAASAKTPGPSSLSSSRAGGSATAAEEGGSGAVPFAFTSTPRSSAFAFASSPLWPPRSAGCGGSTSTGCSRSSGAGGVRLDDGTLSVDLERALDETEALVRSLV